MPKISIVNRTQDRRIYVETNARIEITGPHANLAPAGLESISIEDVLTLDTEREVRIELRGETIAVLVL